MNKKPDKNDITGGGGRSEVATSRVKAHSLHGVSQSMRRQLARAALVDTAASDAEKIHPTL
eukprot:63539-Amphidinium_carterae.1